ncbi:MAG: hypothetical protein R3B40_30845 [Polyangiales bacterium]|nr:hypothetical protein [Myxococcales bacterium]
MTTLADKIADEVRAHPQRPALAALSAALLARLAESELRHLSPDAVSQRVREAGIARTDADFASGNVLDILERGPESDLDHALIAALAVSHWVDLPGARRAEVMAAWTERALWLETQTRYPVFAFVDRLLESHAADAYWDKVGERLLGAQATTPSEAARAAAWCAGLRSSSSAESARILERIAEDASDGVVRAMAAPSVSSGATAHAVQGLAGHAPPGGVRGVIRLLSGWAALQWLGRALAFIVTLRRHTTLQLGGAGVEVLSTTRLMGREVRRSRETFPLRSVQAASREVRYPRAHLLLGAAAFGASLLLGGVWVAEGVRTGETYLLMAGGALMLTGALLDLTLGVLPFGRRGHVAVRLDAADHVRVAIRGAEEARVDGFLRELERRLVGAGE